MRQLVVREIAFRKQKQMPFPGNFYDHISESAKDAFCYLPEVRSHANRVSARDYNESIRHVVLFWLTSKIGLSQ